MTFPAQTKHTPKVEMLDEAPHDVIPDHGSNTEEEMDVPSPWDDHGR